MTAITPRKAAPVVAANVAPDDPLISEGVPRRKPVQVFKIIKIPKNKARATTRLEEGFPILIDYDLGLRNDVLMAEIPYSIIEVRKRSREELMRWRLGLREVFENYINRLGYTVVWFIVKRKETPRSYYVLWRRSLDLILSGDLP